jgi:hypothetical protein
MDRGRKPRDSPDDVDTPVSRSTASVDPDLMLWPIAVLPWAATAKPTHRALRDFKPISEIDYCFGCRIPSPVKGRKTALLIAAIFNISRSHCTAQRQRVDGGRFVA